MSSEPDGWLVATGDGCRLRVWAVPGASRAGVTGLHGAALRVRVTAPPEAGAANREIIRLLAEVLRIRPGDVTLERGATGRRKHVHVRGLGPDDVRARLSVDTPAVGH
jgi:uncharacterized protein (TIGR00251 family)